MLPIKKTSTLSIWLIITNAHSWLYIFLKPLLKPPYINTINLQRPLSIDEPHRGGTSLVVAIPFPLSHIEVASAYIEPSFVSSSPSKRYVAFATASSVFPSSRITSTLHPILLSYITIVSMRLRLVAMHSLSSLYLSRSSYARDYTW